MIRFRIDGVLHEIQRVPKLVNLAITSRIKTMCRMDIAEKRRPQDGRIKTEREGKEIELRVSTLPDRVRRKDGHAHLRPRCPPPRSVRPRLL